ncbi:MAG: hypothetical protein OEV42_19420 [Deltaproteobacteria bacterium]|nr:hypothetical protein [Deltaproteobacteria bacterium]
MDKIKEKKQIMNEIKCVNKEIEKSRRRIELLQNLGMGLTHQLCELEKELTAEGAERRYDNE